MSNFQSWHSRFLFWEISLYYFFEVFCFLPLYVHISECLLSCYWAVWIDFLIYRFSIVFLCLLILLCAVFLNFIFQPFYWVLNFFYCSKISLIELLFFKVRKNYFFYFTDAIFLVGWSCRKLSNTESVPSDPHMPKVLSPILTQSLFPSLSPSKLHSFIYILYTWLKKSHIFLIVRLPCFPLSESLSMRLGAGGQYCFNSLVGCRVLGAWNDV